MNETINKAINMVEQLRNQHLKKDENTAILWMALFEALNEEFLGITLRLSDGLDKELGISAASLHKYKRRNDLEEYKKLFSPEFKKLVIDLLTTGIKEAKNKMPNDKKE